MGQKEISKLMDELTEKEKKIERFSELLESLEDTEDKKKHLWREIYENALNDRECAGVLFTDLLTQSRGNAANHAMFGPIMSKYLERMCKSNEQILRLAELIAKAEETESKINPDDIFSQIDEN